MSILIFLFYFLQNLLCFQKLLSNYLFILFKFIHSQRIFLLNLVNIIQDFLFFSHNK